jgi:hypothetical protein
LVASGCVFAQTNPRTGIIVPYQKFRCHAPGGAARGARVALFVSAQPAGCRKALPPAEYRCDCPSSIVTPASRDAHFAPMLSLHSKKEKMDLLT